ncbi:(deoxy)nucleoside triphosphate pyrophosphohydrolase [Pedobacter sp. P351]|uniref:(deoxy)nucleoside triphosphate pyrophosphohydrolase n=1 Tax=Pedobacter superstes TaxID=3133441 RepID=UPI00309F53F4
MIDVSCAIISDQNQGILVTQRSATMPLPLKWEFPGGKVESGETPEQSLVREIKEELGVNIRITASLSPVVHTYGTKTIRLIPFICHITEGEITLHEHQDYRWLKPGQLLTLDWAEADIPVVKEILKISQLQ